MCTTKQFKAEGKRAFHPQKNPVELNPYPQTRGARAYELWLEGWQEAAKKKGKNVAKNSLRSLNA